MLLDTCAWVEVFNGTDKGMAVKQILREHQCFTSVISIAELSEWIERENSHRSEVLEIVCKTSFIIGVEQDLLELAGILKFKKRRTTPDFGMIDAIILATAQQYNLAVVTGDKHFEGENTVFI